MWKKASGFTLIEMLIVMVIISTLAVLILTNYRSSQKKYALDQAAQKLVSDIRRAQNMAISGVETPGQCSVADPCSGYGVSIRKIDDNFYRIFGDKVDNSRFQPADALIEIINLPLDIEIQAASPIPSKTDIVFEPPEPITFINGNNGVGVLGTITLGVVDTSLTKTITVTTAGLIYSN
jgi:prepilin-type N-terminal cleavage/methylation domain-containing protein